jgi:hypothetical protein
VLGPYAGFHPAASPARLPASSLSRLGLLNRLNFNWPVINGFEEREIRAEAEDPIALATRDFVQKVHLLERVDQLVTGRKRETKLVCDQLDVDDRTSI